MAENALVEGLRGADAFHKNVALMYEDLVAFIREKTLLSPIRELNNENSFWVNGEKESEHRRIFVFEWNGYRFVQVVVKIFEKKLRQNCAQYKAVCATLDIDPIFPLVVAWGIFRPTNALDRFVNDRWTRVRWADNSLLLDLPDQVKIADPASYVWNTNIELASPPETDPMYCEQGSIKLRRIPDIRDTRHIETIVGDLLECDNKVVAADGLINAVG